MQQELVIFEDERTAYCCSEIVAVEESSSADQIEHAASVGYSSDGGQITSQLDRVNRDRRAAGRKPFQLPRLSFMTVLSGASTKNERRVHSAAKEPS